MIVPLHSIYYYHISQTRSIKDGWIFGILKTLIICSRTYAYPLVSSHSSLAEPNTRRILMAGSWTADIPLIQTFQAATQVLESQRALLARIARYSTYTLDSILSRAGEWKHHLHVDLSRSKWKVTSLTPIHISRKYSAVRQGLTQTRLPRDSVNICAPPGKCKNQDQLCKMSSAIEWLATADSIPACRPAGISMPTEFPVGDSAQQQQ